MTEQTPTGSSTLDRRAVLGGAAAAAAGLVVATAMPAGAATPNTRTTAGVPAIKKNPFTLGVSSGDPLPTAVIIWTRLAPSPLALDGGMAAKN